jgi:hypothetical protein
LQHHVLDATPHVTATPDVANLSAMEISFHVETLDNMMSPSKKDRGMGSKGHQSGY